MKFLLRRTHDQLFLQEQDLWTKEPTQALQFPSALTAFLFSVQNHLSHVDVVEMPGATVESLDVTFP